MGLREESLRYLGYRGQQIDDAICAQIDNNIKLINKLSGKGFIYRIFDIYEDEQICLEGTVLKLFGNDIKKHLSGAKKCAVLAATLGMECEKMLMSLSKTKLSEAIIFDAVCTAKIEELTDECEEQIKELAKKEGYYTNFRYSPGYGDFPLDTQKGISAVLGCQKAIGLTVTDSLLMIPQKSVTAVIGLFSDEQKTEKRNCISCSLKNTCRFRKMSEGCEKNGFQK